MGKAKSKEKRVRGEEDRLEKEGAVRVADEAHVAEGNVQVIVGRVVDEGPRNSAKASHAKMTLSSSS